MIHVLVSTLTPIKKLQKREEQQQQQHGAQQLWSRFKLQKLHLCLVMTPTAINSLYILKTLCLVKQNPNGNALRDCILC